MTEYLQGAPSRMVGSEHHERCAYGPGRLVGRGGRRRLHPAVVSAAQDW
jgi:hypothetical protein